MNWQDIKMKWWKPKREQEAEPVTIPDGLKLVYTDLLGNKWFTINNPANIHAMRALTAWSYSRDSEFGLTRGKLETACDKLNEAVNKKDLATIAKVSGVIEAALTLYAEPEIMLNLATCYTFLNDEKNDGYKDFIQDKKREIWQSDNECRAFFLQWSVQFTKRFSESQSKNVLEYLEQTKQVRQQIDFLLRKKSQKAA